MRENLEVAIETIKLASGITLEDDWFAVRSLDVDSLAIGEPAYHQRNWSYLIWDGGDGLLFDTGSGRRSIAQVVARHAGKRVRAFPSHMHFDHLGNINAFGPVIVADLPLLRACASGKSLTPTETMFLGASEAVPVPTFEIGSWIPPGQTIAIGSRHVQVLHTPGHSPDSVSLWEADRNRLYAADFIYHGPLYAQTPGASLRDYLSTCDRLLQDLPSHVQIVCAHGQAKNGIDDAPILGYGDLETVRQVIAGLLETEPHTGETTVNDRISLLYSRESFLA